MLKSNWKLWTAMALLVLGWFIYKYTPQNTVNTTDSVAPKAPAKFMVIKEKVTDSPLDGFYEARIVPADPSPEGTRASLQSLYSQTWQHVKTGSTKPISRFQAWAYASADAYQAGAAPIGRMEQMGMAAAPSIVLNENH